MSAQKESIGIRRHSKRPEAGQGRAADPSSPLARTGPGLARRLGALAVAIAIALAAGAGLAVIRARHSNYPPLLAWDGPDPTSGAQPTELKLAEAALRAPSSVNAQLDLAQFYLDDDRPFEALWVARDAMRLDPKALKPQLLAARAMMAGQLYQPALTLLQGAVRGYTDDADAAQQLADLLLTLGRPAEAASALQALAARQPLSSDALLAYGHALEASGQDAAALQQYQKYQQTQPKSEQAYLQIGKLLFKMGKLSDATQAFMAAQIVNSRSAEARYYQGLIELKQGPAHEEAARQKFAEAVGYNEQFAPAHFQLGLDYERRHDWDRAFAVFSRAFQLDPDNAEAVLQLSRVRRAMGDLAGAAYYQGVYYDATDARPKATAQYKELVATGVDPRGPLLVSSGYIKMDHKEPAAEVARQGLARHPEDTELAARLVALDLLTGNLKEAEQICRDWMRRDPTSMQPVWLLGRVKLAVRDRKSALQLFQRAARVDPKNADYQFALGSVYADQPSPENWEIAARYYGQAVLLRPDDASSRLNLAIALQNIGNLEGARRQFLRSMDKDVNQSAPLNDVVQVARRQKQYDQVDFWAPLVRDVEERLREELPAWKQVWDNPQDAAGYLPLAQFLQRTGELRKACNILQQAVALQPNLAPARRDLQTLQRTLDATS
jgi:tetratricopeptide (TPR) repeat protein